MEYTSLNREAFARRVERGWKWAVPVSPGEMEKVRKGDWRVFLTPTKSVPGKWFPKDLNGLDILGLAAGGGQQMPVLAALGARCTVMDISHEMLRLDRETAEREGLSLTTVEADMTERFPFDDDSFDMIVMPVSLCYVKDTEHVWKECRRVLRKGGILMSGQDTGLNYLFDGEGKLTGKLPYDPLRDDKLMEECIADGSGIQFSHDLSEIIGGEIRAGFHIADIYTDTNDSGVLAEHGVTSFVATLAYRVE